MFIVRDKIENTNFWCMIDSIIQQIVTQLSNCKNIDYDALKIDINQILIKYVILKVLFIQSRILLFFCLN